MRYLLIEHFCFPLFATLQVLSLEGIACLQQNVSLPARIPRDDLVQRMMCRFYASEHGALRGSGLGSYYHYWRLSNDTFRSIPKVPWANANMKVED